MSGAFLQAGALLGWALRLAMAFVFAHSAFVALRDFQAHVAAVRGYKLLPRPAVFTAALLLAAGNAVVAVLLMWPPAGAVGPLLGAALLTVYGGAMGVNIWRGRFWISCGCGGAAGQRISRALVLRNMALGAALCAAAAAPALAAPDAVLVTTLAGTAVSLTALYYAANQLLANAGGRA